MKQLEIIVESDTLDLVFYVKVPIDEEVDIEVCGYDTISGEQERVIETTLTWEKDK